MPIAYDKIKKLEVEEGTPGGDTYYVTLPGGKERAMCLRPVRNSSKPDLEHDWRCSQQAGHRTSHPGQGACRIHGGSDHALANAIIHGRKAYRTRENLQKRIDAFLEDKDMLMDLSYELATIKAIFQEFKAEFPEPSSEDFGIQLQRMTNLIGTIGSLVEKISKTESRATLTAAHVAYLQATIVDLFMKYIANPADRELAVKDLYQRIQVPQYNTNDLPSANGGQKLLQ